MYAHILEEHSPGAGAVVTVEPLGNVSSTASTRVLVVPRPNAAEVGCHRRAPGTNDALNGRTAQSLLWGKTALIPCSRSKEATSDVLPLAARAAVVSPSAGQSREGARA